MREQLLRQALESGKTTSKKQRSKQASLASSGIASRSSSIVNSATNSRPGSATTSRSGSRVGSRTGTDDEHDSLEGFDSDDSGSEDFGSKLEAHLEEADSWESALQARVNNILNRGKRRAEERPDDLRWYTGILQNHFASEEIQPQLSPIVRQLLRASTSEDEAEATLALKALSLTILTDQTEDHFEGCAGPLKSLVQDYGEETTKAAAVRALSLVTFMSGSISDVISVLTFLLEIIESDGSRVLAEDSAPVVAAALHAVSLCCSKLPDLDPDADYLQDIDREFSQEAIEGIAEQLESSAAPVQIAAAEAIALLFEKSYRPATLEDSVHLKEDVHTGELPDVVQKYTPYRQTNQLLDQFQDVSKGSNKSTAKGDRRALNETLRDVLQSLENPSCGPGWRAGEGWKAKGRDNRNVGQKRNLGPSIRVKTDRSGGSFLVAKWWQQIRVRELRSLLGHGFMEHFADNPAVGELLHQEYEGVEDGSSDETDSGSEPEAAHTGRVNGDAIPKVEIAKANGRARKGKKNGRS